MLLVYECNHSKYVDGGVVGTEFVHGICDECRESRRNNRPKLRGKKS